MVNNSSLLKIGIVLKQCQKEFRRSLKNKLK
jgi:hypothetical protein